MGAVEKTGRFVIAGVAVAVVVAIVAVLILMSGNELSNWFSDHFGSPLSGLVPSDAGEGQWHTGFRGSQDRQGLLDDPEKLAAW